MGFLNSVLSAFGNALGLSTNGLTEEMRDRNAAEVERLEQEHPGVREAWEDWRDKFHEFREEYRQQHDKD